jgi:hypothetical protein
MSGILKPDLGKVVWLIAGAFLVPKAMAMIAARRS